MVNLDDQVVVGVGGVVLDGKISPSSAPEDVEFREEVLDCFPEADSHLGYPLPEHLPQVMSLFLVVSRLMEYRVVLGLPSMM